MKTIAYTVVAFIALAGVALADEPTVTLTQTELQEIINAQVAAAQAGPAFKKVQGAFTPATAKPVTPPPTAVPAK